MKSDELGGSTGSGNGASDRGSEPLTLSMVAALEAEADGLDRRTIERLAQARRRALSGQRGVKHGHVSILAGLARPSIAWGALASSVALGVIILASLPDTGTPVPPVTSPLTVDGSGALRDLPLLTDSEDLDFYESVEFLLWLEQQSA